MELKNFKDLIKKVQKNDSIKRVAVAAAMTNTHWRLSLKQPGTSWLSLYWLGIKKKSRKY